MPQNQEKKKSIVKLKGGLAAGTQTNALQLNLSEDVERQPESKIF